MRSTAAARYFFALGLLALALGVRLSVAPLFKIALPYPIVPLSVLLAAWYCGVGPAVMNAVLGYIAIEFVSGTPFGDLLPSAALSIGVDGTIIFFVVKFRSERDKLTLAEVKLRRNEAKLNESQHRIRATFDNAAVGITETDVHRRFVAVNERMCRMLGYSREEMLGMTLDAVTAPEDRELSEEMSSQLRSGKIERCDYDKRYVRKDGSRFWGHVTASSLRDDAGRFVYAIGTIEDISERKRAQESVSLLSQAIESVANGIVLTDRDGRILWVNEAFTRVTGYSVDEAISRTPSLLNSGQQPAEFYKALWDTILAGNTWRGQLVNRRKDGSLYHEEITIVPVRAEGAEITHFVSVGDDVTERIQAEESLRAARQSAEEANQAKDRFLAVLSHELRTPLTPVLAAVQLMQRKPDLKEELRYPLEIIRRNLQLEARLIDDLLDLTRIVQGKLELDRKPIGIAAVIERAVEIAKPDISARKLHFDIDLDEVTLMVNGDGSRLQQVVWNLLSNAVKFTPEGGCVGIRCHRDGARVTIEVTDSGIGIESDVLERIFDAFEQGGRAITRQFGGLGLGLAIAKRLVEIHEGMISAHSAGRNRGSTFRVSLPLVSTTETGEAEKATRAVPPSCRRILLVEDNGDTAAMMKLLLEAFGYEIETAGDVAQALKAVELNGFDLLISDLGLPDQSGIDLMQELRRRGNPLKGIALSGYGREEDVQRSKQAGFSAHLTKPVDAEALADTVSRVM